MDRGVISDGCIELSVLTYMFAMQIYTWICTGRGKHTVKILFPVRKFVFVPEKRHIIPRIKAINAATVGNRLSPLVVFCILNAHQCFQSTTQTHHTQQRQSRYIKHLYGAPRSHPIHSSSRREKRYLTGFLGTGVTIHAPERNGCVISTILYRRGKYALPHSAVRKSYVAVCSVERLDGWNACRCLVCIPYWSRYAHIIDGVREAIKSCRISFLFLSILENWARVY